MSWKTEKIAPRRNSGSLYDGLSIALEFLTLLLVNQLRKFGAKNCSLCPLPVAPEEVKTSPHSPLYSRRADTYLNFDDANMADHANPLSGAVFDTAYKTMPSTATIAYESLARQGALMSPRRWDDVLSPNQANQFSYISDMDHWSRDVEEEFGRELNLAPVLSLALVGSPDDQFIAVATFTGRSAAFPVRYLLNKHRYMKTADEALPPKVRSWLIDFNITVLVPDRVHLDKMRPHDLRVNRIADMSAIYDRYKHHGVVSMPPEQDEATMEGLAVFACGYHHRQAVESQLRRMLGELHYRQGLPRHRDPEWRPRGRQVLDEPTAFYIYFEAVMPQLALNKMMRVGVVYDLLPSLRKCVDLRHMYQTMLRDINAVMDGLFVDAYMERESGAGEEEEEPTYRPSSPLPDIKEEPRTPSPSRPGDDTRLLAVTESERRRDAQQETDVSMRTTDEVEFKVDEALEEELQMSQATTEPLSPIRPPPPPTGPPTYTDDTPFILPLIKTEENEPEEPRAGPSRAGAAAARAASPPAATTTAPEQSETTERAGAATATPPPISLLHSNFPKPKGLLTFKRIPVLPPPPQIKRPPLTGANATPVGRPPYSLFHPYDARARLNLVGQARVFEDHYDMRGGADRAPLDACSHLNAKLKRKWSKGSRRPFSKPEWDVYGDVYVPPFNRFALDNPALPPQQLEVHAFQTDPVFHLRCNFCSASHCSKYIKGSQEYNCRRFWEQDQFAPTRRLCFYPRCTRQEKHLIVVCDALHHICENCGCRGHSPKDKCDITNEAVMARLRQDFEDHGDFGIYTRRRSRRGQLPWGFYPVSKELVKACSYGYLEAMQATEAITFLRSSKVAAEQAGRGGADGPRGPPPYPHFFG